MRATLKLIKQASEVLGQLKKRSEITPEGKRLMTTYSDLMELKLGFYYYNGKEEPLDFTVLKRKYKNITNDNIDQITIAAGEEMNKAFNIHR